MPPAKRKVTAKVVKKRESSDESSEYDTDNGDSRTSVQDKQQMNKRKRVAYEQMDASSDSSSNESETSNEFLTDADAESDLSDDYKDEDDFDPPFKATIKNESNKKATIKSKAGTLNTKLHRNTRKPPAAKRPKRAPVNRKTVCSDTSLVSDDISIESIQPAPKRATRGRPKKPMTAAKKSTTTAKKRAPAKRAATPRQTKKKPTSTWSIPSKEASDASIVEKPKPRKQPRKQPPKPSAKQLKEPTPKKSQPKEDTTITNPITSNPKAITTEPPKEKIVEQKNAPQEKKPRFRFFPFGQATRNADTITIDSIKTVSMDSEEQPDMEDMDMEKPIPVTAEHGQTDENKPEVEEPQEPDENPTDVALVEKPTPMLHFFQPFGKQN